jgi:hypothetical protein
LQYESGDADLALVLHPKYWGIGKIIYNKIIDQAFSQMGLESVTILLPPTRTRIKGVLRQGFKLDGEITIVGERFIRYRLYKGDHRPTNSERLNGDYGWRKKWKTEVQIATTGRKPLQYDFLRILQTPQSDNRKLYG